MLARDIAINAKKIDYDPNLLKIIINRVLKDMKDALQIKKLVETNIQNNKEILKQLEKSFLLMGFNFEYLTKFLSDGNLTKEDLLDFYMADEIKDKFKNIENEIQNL